MKAISLWQPWASAIALGAKRIGAVVAVCRLTDCRKTESFARSELDARRTPPPECGSSDLHWWTERMLGDFTPGRFGWILEDIKPMVIVSEFLGGGCS